MTTDYPTKEEILEALSKATCIEVDSKSFCLVSFPDADAEDLENVNGLLQERLGVDSERLVICNFSPDVKFYKSSDVPEDGFVIVVSSGLEESSRLGFESKVKEFLSTEKVLVQNGPVEFGVIQKPATDSITIVEIPGSNAEERQRLADKISSVLGTEQIIVRGALQ